MKFLDLFIMSVNNLRRRKLRTALTVLGVVIGTASIVVMVSLGVGMNQTLMEQISGSGSLTEITIYQRGGMGGENPEDSYITDKTIKLLEKIPHVESVTPILSTYVMLRQGAYEAQVSITGVSREFLKGIPLKEGVLPKENGSELEFLVGSSIIAQFSNPKKQEYYWETGVLPDVDLMNRPVFVIFDTEAYYQALYGDDPSLKMPKKYLIKTSGLIEGEVEDYNQYSYNVYVEIEALQKTLRQIFKKRPIPGQPTNAKGKPYSYFVYDQVSVYADDMENVMDVQKQITDMGFESYCNMEYVENMMQQSKMVQAVLGGIGAVSLFVAAIGIANTMMMSIYERTREIGIIKVLGCAMKNIRSMFLMEAGFIGLVGGLVGLILSFGISYILNRFFAVMYYGEAGGTLSDIPLWLGLLSLGFAVGVGMIAGFFPALRAMKLSPLAAIKTE